MFGLCTNRLVFNLKVSKLECVDEAIHGCSQLVRAQVTDRYYSLIDDYHSKCSGEVLERSNAGM